MSAKVSGKLPALELSTTKIWLVSVCVLSLSNAITAFLFVFNPLPANAGFSFLYIFHLHST